MGWGLTIAISSKVPGDTDIDILIGSLKFFPVLGGVHRSWGLQGSNQKCWEENWNESDLNFI